MSANAVTGLAIGVVLAKRIDGCILNWHSIATLAERHGVDPYDVVAEAQRIDPPPPLGERRGKRGPDRRPRKIGSGRCQR